MALPVTDNPGEIPSESEMAASTLRRVFSTLSSPRALLLFALLAIGLFLVHAPDAALVPAGIWALAYGIDTLLDPWGHVAAEDTGEAFIILRGLLYTIAGLVFLVNGAVGLAQRF